MRTHSWLLFVNDGGAGVRSNAASRERTGFRNQSPIKTTRRDTMGRVYYALTILIYFFPKWKTWISCSLHRLHIPSIPSWSDLDIFQPGCYEFVPNGPVFPNPFLSAPFYDIRRLIREQVLFLRFLFLDRWNDFLSNSVLQK